MKQIIIILSLLFFGLNLKGQTVEFIDVADLTLKVRGNKELYYGFAAGDKIIFSFEEQTGKSLKEIEIIRYPEETKFQDYKCSEVTDKEILVQEEGIYLFRFKSAGLKAHTCKINIKRKPNSAAQLYFDTGVRIVEQLDTIFKVNTKNVITGYETFNVQKSRRVLTSVDTNVIQIVNRTERVHSLTNPNSNVSWIQFDLPTNTYSPNIFKPYRTTETVSWAYSIMNDEIKENWYQNANKRAQAKGATKLAVSAGLITSSYGALAMLALEGVSLFHTPPKGDNIQFDIVKSVDGQKYSIQKGNSVAAFDRVLDDNKGAFAIRLTNDNLMSGINVFVEVIAVQVTKNYKDEYYTVQERKAIKEKQVIKEPRKVEVRKVPILKRKLNR